MRTLSVALVGALVIAVSCTSAHAVESNKCRLPGNKFTQAQKRVIDQEKALKKADDKYADIEMRGSERSAFLEGRIADAQGQMDSVNIQTAGDVVGCWLSPRRCADSTVRRMGQRYGQAVRMKTKSEGVLRAWLVSLQRRLEVAAKRVAKEGNELAIRQQALATAEAAYEACVG